MNSSPILFLRYFADKDSEGCRLNTKAQAESVIQAIKASESRWVDLDFSGITELNWEFALEFSHLAETVLPEGIWLVPRNYNYSANKLIGSLISRLKILREQAWRDSYDWMWRKTESSQDHKD